MTGAADQDRVAGLRAAAEAALAAGQDDVAMSTFAEATRLAGEALAPADPVRLGVARVYGEAWFGSRDDPATALEIARAAYEEAVFAIEDVPDDQYRDAVQQLSQLRDQMTFWAFRMTSSG